MSDFKEYPIFKKRDGQSFKEVGYIFSDSFEKAKKEFALNMTKENWEKPNNIVWLTKEEGVKVTGWYDLDGSVVVYNDEGDEPDYNLSIMALFCPEEAINEGFDSWSEDVYTWELRDVCELEEEE